jgi:hypothetical protein
LRDALHGKAALTINGRRLRRWRASRRCRDYEGGVSRTFAMMPTNKLTTATTTVAIAMMSAISDAEMSSRYL